MCAEWRNSFLLVDEIKFLLYQCPSLHGDAWFDKDGQYSINCQVCAELSNHGVSIVLITSIQLVVVPHNLTIADYSVGHTGSIHNSWAFHSTRTSREYNQRSLS
jgi:hypothetical protein